MRTWKIAQTFTFACLAGCGSGPATVLAPEARPHPPRQSITAKQVLAYLTSLPLRSERRLLSGQNVGHGPTAAKGYDAYVVNLHKATGKWPAFVTADYAFGSVNAGWIDQVNQTVKGHWDSGGLVSINIASLNNPFTGGNCKDRGDVDLAQLATPGARGNAAWMACLDVIAAGLAGLRDAGVVVLWRPLHEMNMADFWWGCAPAENYVRLWRHMHRYFMREKGLDNLLWVYSPAANPWGAKHILAADAYYPGPEYVDIVGLDYYANDFARIGPAGYDALVKLGKPFGLTECGPELNLSQFFSHDLAMEVEGIQRHAPLATFWWHWHSWGLSKMALVDQEGVKAALVHPSVVNRDDLDILAGRSFSSR